MTKSNGIKDLKQAAKLLNKHAPKGESLAYINPTEAKILKAYGGSGIMTVAGVPSYDWWNPTTWDWSSDDGIIAKGKKLLGYDKPVDEGGRSIVNDAIGVYGFLKAKKDQEGLNKFEMEQFNNLTAQLSEAQAQFDANIGGGPLVTNVPTTTEDVASFTDVTLPTMRTTAVAQGGRIGYNMGGIGAMDPRIGYQVGSSDIPGIPGVGKAMRDMDFPTFSEGVKQEFPSNELGVIDTTVQEDVLTTGGNQIQNSAMALIQSGTASNSTEALRGAYTLNSIEAQFPGVTNVALKLIEANQASGVMDAIQQAITIMQGSKQIQSNVDSIDFSEFLPQENKAYGGRIGYDKGTHPLDQVAMDTFGMPFEELNILQQMVVSQSQSKAHGGRIGAKEGGIMPLLNMGGMEKDYRQDGGFVPIGRREKADDVPARLSKNEFVFTADAVRAAGGGDIDEGAQRMYNVMKNLEAGGEISEQSQGQG